MDVNGSNLHTDSEPKSVGLVSGLVATWCWVCIHHMNRVNSHSLTVGMPWLTAL